MHIGKMIQREFKKSGMTAQAFADELACHRQNVYKIFEKPDISTDLLWRISIILKHDFFAEISENTDFCTEFGDSLQNGDTGERKC